MPIVKEFYIIYLIISCVFLLPTKMYAKRVECRYNNHNENFSLHAKMSVITLLSFIMNSIIRLTRKIPDNYSNLQPLLYVISQSALTYVSYFSAICASSRYGITTKIIASSFT